jgi:beta-N-acetylhexosaminidase
VSLRNNLSHIEFLAGQRLLLGFDGTQLNDDLKHLIRDIQTAGIILFAQNIDTPDQVKSLCRECQQFARSCGLPPLIVAVDQEGGTVARLKNGFTRFDGNPAIRSVDDARYFARITARELKSVGIHMNFAPVLDVVSDQPDSIMKDRAFQGDAQQVAVLGTAVIETFQQHGLMAVAKHFPGIGRTVLDSHFHLPTLDAPVNELESSDLIPFKAAMEKAVSGMMLSHIFYPQLDAQWQASLSSAIARDLLRKQMNYDGLVMTDDLDMKAIGHDIQTCLYQIMIAQIDLALICHKGPNIDTAFAYLCSAMSDDPHLLEMGQTAVQRILRFKNKYISD